jgi:hypothetical protein
VLWAVLLRLGAAAADSICPGSSGLGNGGTGFPALITWAGLGTVGCGQAGIRSRADVPRWASVFRRADISR